MNRPRVVIADDHHILVEGVRRLLESDYEITGTAANGRELVETVTRLKPELVVLDIGMPLLNGIEASRQIKSALPAIRIVFLTQQADKAYVHAAFRSGACAYVLKQSAATELLQAMKEATAGRYYVSPSLTSEDIKGRFDANRNPSELFGGSLTPRQREVLQLVAEGKGAKEIATIMGISVKTVEFHKSAIMDELGLRTTAELTRYAIEHGILT